MPELSFRSVIRPESLKSTLISMNTHWSIVYDAFKDQFEQAADTFRNSTDDKTKSYLQYWDEFKAYCEKLRTYNLVDIDSLSDLDLEYLVTGFSFTVKMREIADHLFSTEIIDILPRLEASLEKNLTESQLQEVKSETYNFIEQKCLLVSLFGIQSASVQYMFSNFLIQNNFILAQETKPNKYECFSEQEFSQVIPIGKNRHLLVQNSSIVLKDDIAGTSKTLVSVGKQQGYSFDDRFNKIMHFCTSSSTLFFMVHPRGRWYEYCKVSVPKPQELTEENLKVEVVLKLKEEARSEGFALHGSELLCFVVSGFDGRDFLRIIKWDITAKDSPPKLDAVLGDLCDMSGLSDLFLEVKGDLTKHLTINEQIANSRDMLVKAEYRDINSMTVALLGVCHTNKRPLALSKMMIPIPPLPNSRGFVPCNLLKLSSIGDTLCCLVLDEIADRVRLVALKNLKFVTLIDCKACPGLIPTNPDSLTTLDTHGKITNWRTEFKNGKLGLFSDAFKLKV